MPARYVINLALVVGFYFLLTGLISSGIITNYWTGILITVGINIILAVSLNIATGYLGQLPLGQFLPFSARRHKRADFLLIHMHHLLLAL